MTRHDKACILAIWVGWAVLMTFIFFGCAAPAKANSSPWTSYMAEEHNLSMCDKAQVMLDLANAQDAKLGEIMNGPNISNEVKQVLKAQRQGLWQLEEDIQYWQRTSCAKA
jgi:Spy/CpxP family protein refolding chaperone